MKMNRFKIVNMLIFSIHFMILAIQVVSSLYGTLNFDRQNHALIDIESKIERGALTIDHELAVACPAQFHHEVEFNSKHSFGKNSLFVRGIYGALADPQFVDNFICEDAYKLSISYHRSVQEIEFGYEVYYDIKNYSHFSDSNYDQYDPVSMAYSKTRLITGNLFTSKNKLKLETRAGDPLTLGFIWILIFRLKFDNSTKRPIQAIYTLSKSTEMGAKCANYSLGDEVYQQDKSDYMDSLYRNQVDIFKNVLLTGADDNCEKENKCLTKYSLVPAEEFRFRSPKPTQISCSNLTTVPIWQRTTEDALKHLDMFLYALSHFAHKGITVVAGVHGQLALGKSTSLMGNIKINLGGIPVPNIIYKSISYEFVIHEKDAESAKDGYNFTSKAIVIVIHNEPNFKESDALCPKENCEKWGWNEIANKFSRLGSDSAPNNIFCCPRNEEIAAKFNMKNNFIHTDELNLREFPMFDKHQGKVVTEDIEEKVISKMIEILVEGEDGEDGEDAKSDHTDAHLVQGGQYWNSGGSSEMGF